MAFLSIMDRAGDFITRVVCRMGFASFLAIAILLIVLAFIVELVINALGDGKVGAFSRRLKKFLSKQSGIDSSNALKFDAKCGKVFSKNSRILWKNYLNQKSDAAKQCFIAGFTTGKCAATKSGIYRVISAICGLMLIAVAIITKTNAGTFLLAAVFPLIIYLFLAFILNLANNYFNRTCFRAIEYIVAELSEKMDLSIIAAKPVANSCKTLDEKLTDNEQKIDYLDQISKQVDSLILSSHSKDTFTRVLSSLEAAYRHNYMKKESRARLFEIIERVKIAMAAL